ncbi:acyl-CoA dehydrogenase family protein [Thermodesulfobacteriota bacterium]
MDFEFTEEQNILRKTIRKFLSQEWSREKDRYYDEHKEFPEDMYQRLAELGYLGYPFPAKYGGGDGGIIDFVIIAEEFAKVSYTVTTTWAVPVLFGGEHLMYCGSEKQKYKYLPGICNGELKFSFALTEADVGSDASAVRTSAVRDGKDFNINGTKMIITGADIADYVVTVVKTDADARKYKGLTLFIVDTKTEGFQTRVLDKLGGRSNAACEVIYDDVRVSEESIMGGPDFVNQGWGQMLTGLDTERILMAAQGIGFSAQILNDIIRYAKERTQFGQAIGKYQAISHPIADLATEVEMARTFVYYAAWLKSEERPCSKEASMAKLAVTELSKKLALQGMQTMGAYGYMMEFDMQRHLRDALLGPIGGGTSEIQRNVIAKQLGL